MPATAERPGAPLELEGKLPLGSVAGRIDHLAIDLNRQRLFVAELGNNSVGVVDLARARTQSTIPGLNEPQGIAYEPSTDTVYIANAADGSVRILRGEDLALIGRINLGDDADNIRVDARHNRVLVGYGDGALAIIDPKSRTKIGDIRLKAHPESFQIDNSGTRAYVNVPDARQIAVADLAKGEVIGTMPTEGHGSNFAMALDRNANRVLTVFRSPSRLLVLSMMNNAVVADLKTCDNAVVADLKTC
ncbi:YncE family protein, partial [Bradyrhizobium sp.]|uniref:YncE family protein n=1 Tax=Bradyrhizobium sp. TaxID=376 RepID=UPI0039C8A94A